MELEVLIFMSLVVVDFGWEYACMLMVVLCCLSAGLPEFEPASPLRGCLI